MWIAGDADLPRPRSWRVVVGWMRAEERDAARADRRADAELADDPRSASARLAERLADERERPSDRLSLGERRVEVARGSAPDRRCRR